MPAEGADPQGTAPARGRERVRPRVRRAYRVGGHGPLPALHLPRNTSRLLECLYGYKYEWTVSQHCKHGSQSMSTRFILNVDYQLPY